MKIKRRSLRNIIFVGIVLVIVATTDFVARITSISFSSEAIIDKNSVSIQALHENPPTLSPSNTIGPKNVSVNHKSSFNVSRERYLLTYEPYGQLGNMMFQYAGLLGVAKMNDRIPFIQPNSILTRAFKISHIKSVPNPQKWKILGEPNYAKYDKTYENLPLENVYLQTYFQSNRYFQFIADEVKHEFRFLDAINNGANIMLDKFKVKFGSRILVGVHVRRGDKLSRKESNMGELTAPVGYFKKAFDWMRKKYGDVVFLVATDDISWCKRNIVNGEDVILLPPSQREIHLCVLTKCDHVIMSVGTFGWWGGWLGKGDVIYYNHPVKEGTWKYDRFNATEFYPPHWIGIGD